MCLDLPVGIQQLGKDRVARFHGGQSLPVECQEERITWRHLLVTQCIPQKAHLSSQVGLQGVLDGASLCSRRHNVKGQVGIPPTVKVGLASVGCQPACQRAIGIVLGRVAKAYQPQAWVARSDLFQIAGSAIIFQWVFVSREEIGLKPFGSVILKGGALELVSQNQGIARLSIGFYVGHHLAVASLHIGIIGIVVVQTIHTPQDQDTSTHCTQRTPETSDRHHAPCGQQVEGRSNEEQIPGIEKGHDGIDHPGQNEW